MIDIEKAREQEKWLRPQTTDAYGFRLIGAMKARDIADTIAALLDENRKAWTSVSEISLRLAEVLNERDALARDTERYLKIRQARSLLQLYVYDDPEDLYSGGWFYKPTPEEVDAFCDAMKGASDE